MRNINSKDLQINNNWLERFPWLDEEEVRCVVCGQKGRLERSHLIPKALGGSNNIDNLVMLCHEHHKNAPNSGVDKEIMLLWIEREAEKFSELGDCFCYLKIE